MARVTRARLQTAYDAGRQAAPDGVPPPDYIAGDPELLGAWDEGYADAQDGAAPRRYTPDGTLSRPGAHRPAPARPKRSSGRAKPRPEPAGGDPSSPDAQLPPVKPVDHPHPVRATTGALRRVSLTPAADNIGGFVCGLLLYAVGIQYIRNGPGGPLAWFRAKFENKPLGAHTPAAASTSSGAAVSPTSAAALANLNLPSAAQLGSAASLPGTFNQQLAQQAVARGWINPVLGALNSGGPPVSIAAPGAAPRPAGSPSSLSDLLAVR